jgi:uncharacterized membrane protein
VAVNASIEIGRPPDDVFAYLDDLERHGEWQEAIEDAHVETEGPTRVGTIVRERRRVPGRVQEFRYRVTEHDPPGRFAFAGIDGPVRVIGSVNLAAVGDDRTRLSLELDFEGHGFGRLLVPLARRDARKTVPRDQQRLKERLESGAS